MDIEFLNSFSRLFTENPGLLVALYFIYRLKKISLELRRTDENETKRNIDK